jgi:hypothetical protein
MDRYVREIPKASSFSIQADIGVASTVARVDLRWAPHITDHNA